MLTAAAFFLTAHNLLAAANPGAPLLSQDRFAFCHDESFPLTGKDARWCPLVGEKNAVCPSLPAACLKPPTAVDLELTLGGGSGSGDSDDGDGDGQVEPDKEPPDDGDGDAEGRASRGDVRLHLKPGQGGSGDGSGSGNGNGSGNGSGTGNGAGTGTGNGNGSGDTAGDGNSSPNSSGDTPHSGGSGQPTAGDRTPGTPSSDPSAKAPPTPEAPEPPPPPPPPPPPQGLSVFAQVLLFAILGVGLFLLIRAIAKHLSWRKKKDEDADDIAPEQTEAQAVVPERRGPVETDVERLLRRAQEAAARGDFERAVEDAYAALLRRLDGAGLIEIHPSRTNGDYVRALRDRPELRTNVRAIVRDVERVQFGDEPPNANIFRAVFDRVVPIATRAITVLGVIFVASILTSGGDAHARDRLGDTGPYGTAVLDELLEQRGRDVTHRTDPLGNIEDESTSKVLVLLRGASIDKDTWRRVIAWTREGGTLVVAGLRHLPKELGAEPTNDPSEEATLTRQSSYEYGYKYSEYTVRAPTGTSLRTDLGESSWVLARGEEPYAVSRYVGKGRAFVFAERALFTNIAFTVADSGAFTVELLDDLGKDDIEICNVWTGAGAGSPLEAMDRANLTPVIAQLLAVILLFLVWRGAHFGQPRDPRPKSRRAFADHVKALGHIYHRASASEHALGNFSAWAIERLRERYFRGTRSGLTPLAEAISARTGVAESEVMRVLVEAQSARETSGPPSSFRPGFRPDFRAPPKNADEQRNLQLIRALFNFLRTSKLNPKGQKTSTPS